MTEFQRLLVREMREMKPAVFARKIGVKRTTLESWLNGTTPSVENAESVIRKLGGVVYWGFPHVPEFNKGAWVYDKANLALIELEAANARAERFERAMLKAQQACQTVAHDIGKELQS